MGAHQERFLLPDTDPSIERHLKELMIERSEDNDSKSSTQSWQALHLSLAEKRTFDYLEMSSGISPIGSTLNLCRADHFAYRITESYNLIIFFLSSDLVLLFIRFMWL